MVLTVTMVGPQAQWAKRSSKDLPPLLSLSACSSSGSTQSHRSLIARDRTRGATCRASAHECKTADQADQACSRTNASVTCCASLTAMALQDRENERKNKKEKVCPARGKEFH